MTDDLAVIQLALRERGMSSYQQQPNQLVVSRQRGPAWPNAGNSFWICRLEEHWYICTWAPRHYRVPSEQSVIDVCEAFVDIGTSAQWCVPADLTARFALVETNVDDFDRLWAAASSS